MAPSTIINENGLDSFPISKTKAANHAEQAAEPKPVADNFMYDFKYNHALPTSDVLGIEIPQDCDAQKEAGNIVARLLEVMGRGDAKAFADMFLEYGRLCIPSQITFQVRLTVNLKAIGATSWYLLGTIARSISSPRFSRLQMIFSSKRKLETLHS